MSDARLEISINGEYFTTAGVSKTNNPVLSQGLSYVTRHQPAGDAGPRFEFSVSGSEWDKDNLHCHFTWGVKHLTAGDEIAIRILGPGDCDLPIHRIYDSIIEDSQLGKLVSIGGGWNTRVQVAGTDYELNLQIPGESNGISGKSREFCLKIMQSLEQLISEALNSLSEKLSGGFSVEDLKKRLIPKVGVDIEREENHEPHSFNLKLDFHAVSLEPEATTGFFFDFLDWKIQSVVEVF